MQAFAVFSILSLEAPLGNSECQLLFLPLPSAGWHNLRPQRSEDQQNSWGPRDQLGCTAVLSRCEAVLSGLSRCGDELDLWGIIFKSFLISHSFLETRDIEGNNSCSHLETTDFLVDLSVHNKSLQDCWWICLWITKNIQGWWWICLLITKFLADSSVDKKLLVDLSVDNKNLQDVWWICLWITKLL